MAQRSLLEAYPWFRSFFSLLFSMFMTCDSDAAVFILNVSLTSTFCLRRECKSLKPAVVLLLAVSDWCAVVMRSFYRLSRDKDLWFVTSCICEQPQVLLQTGNYVWYLPNLYFQVTVWLPYIFNIYDRKFRFRLRDSKTVHVQFWFKGQKPFFVMS